MNKQGSPKAVYMKRRMHPASFSAHLTKNLAPQPEFNRVLKEAENAAAITIPNADLLQNEQQKKLKPKTPQRRKMAEPMP